MLIVNIAFVNQNFAAQNFVAGKSVAGKFEPAQAKLLAFVDRNLNIDDAFIRIRRIVLEFRVELGIVKHKALRAVNFFQIFVNALPASVFRRQSRLFANRR